MRDARRAKWRRGGEDEMRARNNVWEVEMGIGMGMGMGMGVAKRA